MLDVVASPAAAPAPPPFACACEADDGLRGAATSPGILVVDDDVDVRDSVAFLLTDEGYDVHTAADGRQALALLERIPRPALALVDLRMPVMDGLELIEVLRSDPRWAGLPIVAFSAASTVAAPPEIPLLRKPISVARLLDAVRSHSATH